MSISKQPPKPFPIKKGLPCQLKWTHSTIYLTDGVSASCHRVQGDFFKDLENGINGGEKRLQGCYHACGV